MNMRRLLDAIRAIAGSPSDGRNVLSRVPAVIAGAAFARVWKAGSEAGDTASLPAPNPLRDFFEGTTTGPGVWKWRHYFDIYHRHLAKFVGRDAHLLEIGVYSGGSLDMWRQYLGERCTIHGVDIAPECRVYERENVHISIGDQEDRGFWKTFREKTPLLDIVIDDGGHTAGQQIVTLEELLPHLRPGGVFLCEDVHGTHHDFAAFVGDGMVSELNRMDALEADILAARPTAFQRGVYSIHFYPYVVVIERTETPPTAFTAPKHGSDWQPFPV